MNARESRPWWVDLAINVAPLVIILAWQNWDTIGPWLDTLRDRLIPAVVEVDPDRLDFLRKRYEAGGWAGEADRFNDAQQDEGTVASDGSDSAGADHAD